MRARVACCLWEHFRGSGCAGEGEAARGGVGGGRWGEVGQRRVTSLTACSGNEGIDNGSGCIRIVPAGLKSRFFGVLNGAPFT